MFNKITIGLICGFVMCGCTFFTRAEPDSIRTSDAKVKHVLNKPQFVGEYGVDEELQLPLIPLIRRASTEPSPDAVIVFEDSEVIADSTFFFQDVRIHLDIGMPTIDTGTFSMDTGTFSMDAGTTTSFPDATSPSSLRQVEMFVTADPSALVLLPNRQNRYWGRIEIHRCFQPAGAIECGPTNASTLIYNDWVGDRAPLVVLLRVPSVDTRCVFILNGSQVARVAVPIVPQSGTYPSCTYHFR
jgi:hypothetical protein